MIREWDERLATPKIVLTNANAEFSGFQSWALDDIFKQY
jgi:hypothetical protein